MPTGYSAAGQCWPTQAEALDAYYSGMPPHTNGYYYDGTSGMYTYLAVPVNTPSGWMLNRTTCGAALGGCVNNSPISLPTNVTGICTLTAGDAIDPVESFFDGHVLGWGVALAMAAAWGIHILRRAAT